MIDVRYSDCGAHHQLVIVSLREQLAEKSDRVDYFSMREFNLKIEQCGS
jgi:hypothetical protein